MAAELRPIETTMEEESGIKDLETNKVETNHVYEQIDKTNDVDSSVIQHGDGDNGREEEPSATPENNTNRSLNGESHENEKLDMDTESTKKIDTLSEKMDEDVEHQDNRDADETDTRSNHENTETLSAEKELDEDKEIIDNNETLTDSVKNTEENNVEEVTSHQEKTSNEELEEMDNISDSNSKVIPDSEDNDNIVEVDNDEDCNLDLNAPCSNTENELITNSNSPETNETSSNFVTSNSILEDAEAEDADKLVTTEADPVNQENTLEDVPYQMEESVNDAIIKPVPIEEEIQNQSEKIGGVSVGGDSDQDMQDKQGKDSTKDKTEFVENEIKDDGGHETSNPCNDYDLQENGSVDEIEEIQDNSLDDKNTLEGMESRSMDSFEVTENEQCLLDDSNSADYLTSNKEKATTAESVEPSDSDKSDSGEKREMSENIDELQDSSNLEKEKKVNELKENETAREIKEDTSNINEQIENVSQSQTNVTSEELAENIDSVPADIESTEISEDKTDQDISKESQDDPTSEVLDSVSESLRKEEESITMSDDSREAQEVSLQSVIEKMEDEPIVKETDSAEEDKKATTEVEVMETDATVGVVQEESGRSEKITENDRIDTDVQVEDANEISSKEIIDKDVTENDSNSAEPMDITDAENVTTLEESVKDPGDSKKAGVAKVDEEAMDVADIGPAVQVQDKTTDSSETVDNETSEPASNEIPEVGEVKKEIEEKSDAPFGLKIDGVTSVESTQDKSKLNHSGLELKIDSVIGAGDSKAKDEKKSKEESKPITIKKEKMEQDIVEKKEPVKQTETDTKKQDNDDDEVIAIKEEKKPPPKPKSSKIQKCIVCAKVGKCKYNIVRNGDVKHLCDDKCFKQFRSDPTSFLKQAEREKEKDQKKEVSNKVPAKEPLQPASTNLKNVMASKTIGGEIYKTCTVCQLMNVKTSKPFLNWQGLDYCGEECLGKFQGNLSVTCTYCSSQIHQTNKAKFCARIGSDVKHFCSQTCNTEFVKRIKVCAFCNKDLAKENDSFMAPVGNQGMFKDFCSQACLLKYEDKHSKDVEVTGELIQGTKTAVAPTGNFTCAVCSKSGPIKHELKLENKLHRLCSDPCFSAFQYANKLTLNCCDSCGTPCNQSNDAPHFVQFEGKQKRFCSFMCVNQFRNQKRKLTPCAWCGNKKSNFDMIERVDSNNKFQLFCSLNCLSLYRVNLQATSNQAVLCDQCQKFVPAQYHLTMSDASVRNFCSYGCVMQFQAQFQTPTAQKQPAQNSTQKQVQTTSPPVTTTRSGRVVKGGARQQQYMDTQQQQQQKKETNKQVNKANQNQDSFPIISNVVSLAPKGNQQQINIRSAGNVTVTDQQSGKTITTSTGNQTVQQQIIIQPPPPKSVKNKALLCKPFVQTKATACRPHTQTKEVQTEGKPQPDKIFVPIPVPIYCPTPLSMYSLPAPVLVPVPVPIPVPVFIPTTKKNSASILKQIKEIQEKIPADPLEAELLMMAEAVAGKGEESSSESDEGEAEAPASKEVTPATGGVLGEDMLQMALRMASEMSDEPVMDLETSLEPVAVNTVPPVPPPPPPQVKEVDSDDDEEYVPTTRAKRGRGSSKRQTRSTPRRNSKRQKTEMIPQPQYHTPTPSPPQPQAPPPDSNFHLKYTYGVNAFKYWVTQKNSQLEETGKSGHARNLKTFKTDILQCTADELNHALCLFVKEVRKPNTEEYAVDSIYYLCLGIQQYLFENGRIDNVFTDMYYERFTECLNELLCKYEPKLNQAGQLVCRIEEEHLWESKQLGAHSPHVLLNTLVYFNTKYFMLKTSEDHLKLSFTHIMKHWKKTASGRGSGVGVNAGRSVYLRYYCPTPQNKDNNSKKKKEEMPVYEQTENLDNPLRCPVKLYEFYLSKCPESIKNRNDTFYLIPERSCVPDSPVWYSTAMLGVDAMAKMLNRIRLVREIQEAHLHTQPIYI